MIDIILNNIIPLIRRENDQKPDPSEHYEDFLVNHKCMGWLACQAVFDEKDKFMHFSDFDPCSCIEISDCDYYYKLPQSTE